MLLCSSPLIGAYQIVHVDIDVLHPVGIHRRGGGSVVDLGCGWVYGKERDRIQRVGIRLVCDVI